MTSAAGQAWWMARATCLLATAALAACGGSLLQTDLPPNEIYVLAAAPAAANRAVEPLAVDVSIGRPAVGPGLDSDRVPVLNGRRLDYYRTARWGGSTADVVQTFLVDSIEDQGLFRSVTAEQTRVAGDYVLDVQLRDFQAEYAGANAAPTVRVRMVGHVIRILDRELVATIAAEALRPSSENRMHAVAAAFEAAAQNVALELAQQAHAAIRDDRARDGHMKSTEAKSE